MHIQAHSGGIVKVQITIDESMLFGGDRELQNFFVANLGPQLKELVQGIASSMHGLAISGPMAGVWFMHIADGLREANRNVLADMELEKSGVSPVEILEEYIKRRTAEEGFDTGPFGDFINNQLE